MPYSGEIKYLFVSIINMTWWHVGCILLIVLVNYLIIILRTFSDSRPCSSSRSHCCVETFVIPLSFVILYGLYTSMIVILLWFFPSIVEKDHLLKTFRSCPDFVTLWLNVLVTIVVTPPGLYLDYHVIFVSDMINFFLSWQTILITFWIDVLTCGFTNCRLISDRPAISMFTFLMESHTSSSVEKWEDSISLIFWPSILVGDPDVVCRASLNVILLIM